jgi:hypothetical protein
MRAAAPGAVVALLGLAALVLAGCEDFGDPVQPENGGGDGFETVTLVASKDNTLYDNPQGDVSNGSGAGLFAGTVGAAGGLRRRRALLAFDIAGGIPAGATIESARLVLEVSRTASGTKAVRLHRVLADWGEGSSNAPRNPAGGGDGIGAQAAPGDATWLHRFFDNVAWSAPGGDFASTPSAETQVTGIGSYTWGSTPGMIADVQEWLDGAAGNFGWILVGEESGTTSAKRFYSREHASAGVRPRLVVEYTPPPAARARP